MNFHRLPPPRRARNPNPVKGTTSLRTFVATTRDLFHFGTLLQSVPKLIDELRGFEDESPEILHLMAHGYERWRIVEDWKRFSCLTDEVILMRMVDSLHTYLVDVIRLCLKHEPRLLRSGATVRIDDVLRFESINDLQEWLVSRQLEELSYGGFHGILDFISRRTGAVLKLDEESVFAVTNAIAVRNIIVHNASIINSRFITQTKRRDVSVGQVYNLLTDEVLGLLHHFDTIVPAIDHTLVDHLKLPTGLVFEEDDEPVARDDGVVQ